MSNRDWDLVTAFATLFGTICIGAFIGLSLSTIIWILIK